MDRIHEIYQLYDKALENLNTSAEWKRLIINTAPHWKHTFDEQLLVNSQGKDYQLLTTMATWNKVGRYINRGSKGIAVFKHRTDTQLIYLFDLSQTNGKEIDMPWKLSNVDVQSEVVGRFNKKYGKDFKSIDEVIDLTFKASCLAEHDNCLQQLATVGNKKEIDAMRLIKDTARLIISARCGLPIPDFNFSEIGNAIPARLKAVIGEEANKIAANVLLEIEHNIRRARTYENETDWLNIQGYSERSAFTAASFNEPRGAATDGTESYRPFERNRHDGTGYDKYGRSDGTSDERSGGARIETENRHDNELDKSGNEPRSIAIRTAGSDENGDNDRSRENSGRGTDTTNDVNQQSNLHSANAQRTESLGTPEVIDEAEQLAERCAALGRDYTKFEIDKEHELVSCSFFVDEKLFKYSISFGTVKERVEAMDYTFEGTVGKDENSDPFYQPTDYVDSFEIGIDEDDFIEAATDFLSNVSENDNAIIADSGITVEQLFKSIVDIDVEKEKPLSFEQRLYNKLYEFAAPVLNGSAYYMCLESAGYEKLVVENIGGEYSIAHYYQQNGDAMRDPEITFTIKGNAVEPTSFFQDNMKCYYTCDECSKKDINDLKSFMKTWFNNITQQGYAATKVEYYEQTEALDSEIEVRHNVAVAEVAELVTPSDYAAAFGIDEAILNRLVGLHLNESNINEFGRYDELRKTVDKSKAKAYFDRLDNADTPLHKVNMRLDKLLREFIIDADNVAESGQREEQTGVNDDLIDTDVANIGQLTLFENATLSKKQLERLNELSDHIKTEFEHWKSIFINGSTDRMYADGVGLELTRNHIIYYKHLLSEEFPNNLPAIYEKPLPPDISNNYCALDIGDKIMYEDRLFRVESISEESNLEMRSVSLFDIEMSKVYPISRACSLVDLKGRYENLTKEAKYDELMKQLTPVATADYETVREQEIEKEDKEPRYEVEYTSDAFSDKDDVFCVRDTINDELVTDIDDKVVTFSADEEDTADEYCDKLNSENDEVRHNVAVATEEDAQEVRHNVAVEAAHNYRWDGENIYSTGPKAKFTDNINAIKMLYKLENEKRNATPEEQLVLAKYVGWGGLAKAFDETETAWSKEYNELKALLPKREYNAAMESTLTAYYTDPNIAVAMWNTIKQLGFTGGKILEPSCATGNFLSTIPADIADNSDITGVEIDHITGRIAKKLFPNADIQVRGFESTHFENETFDVIIGNVPFGNFDVHDSAYKDDMLIHDYFFIKSLDKVKDGGIVAFITSTGTLDKYSTTIREQLAGKAELLNAVRLPNNAFSAIAGTQTATDIIILQKNINAVEMRDKSPDWTLPIADLRDGHVYRGEVNRFYISHPDNLLANVEYKMGRFGRETFFLPRENQNLNSEVAVALSTTEGKFFAEPTVYSPVTDDVIDEESRADIPDGIRPYTFYIGSEDKLCFADGTKETVLAGDRNAARITAMTKIAEELREVIDVQLYNRGNDALAAAQKDLNADYDAFVKKYGYLNSRTNTNAFNDDVRAALVLSLECPVADTEEYEKAAIFTQATISPSKDINNVETAQDALVASLNTKGRVDLDFMSSLLGKDVNDIIEECGNRIYRNPLTAVESDITSGWETAEEYLSGYVVEKLRVAEEYAKDVPEFERNVEALKNSQPDYVFIDDIDFSIGAPYIPLAMYREFIYDILKTPQVCQVGVSWNNRNSVVDVIYQPALNSWNVTHKNANGFGVLATESYGTRRKNAYEIFEDTLNLKKVEVKDKVRFIDSGGNEVIKRVLNKNETILAREKQGKIEAEFKNWIRSDKTRSETIEKIYNNTYNAIKPRTYNGEWIEVKGISTELKLRPHQKSAVARIAADGRALLAHEVGSGKTAAMAAAGMYLKNIGALHKALYVVPKPIVSQWGGEFMRFFPSARLLITTEKDFEKKNRRRFLAKIASGDFDAIVMSQSQFEKIPLSFDRQREYIEDKIENISRAIAELKAQDGEKYGVKQMMSKRKSLEAHIEKLSADFKKDNFITFEELGCDFLFVDEAHAYKNLALFTKLTNVSGVNSANSQRASDMEMKCDYIREINNGGGVVFATGTPINTL